jgi:hypothetical protein
MYVRLVYVTGDPAKLEDALAGLTGEGQKLLSEHPGFRGLGLFVDREVGKLLMGTWWESEDARKHSGETLGERRTALLAPFAQTITIDNFEAAIARRPERVFGVGAGFRLSRVEFAPADADLLEETFRSKILPRFEPIPGFAGVSLLLDRAAGQGTIGGLYADHRAMADSRAAAGMVRADTFHQARLTLRSLEEFEVVSAGPAPA